MPFAGERARRERTRGFSASEEFVAGAASEVDACAVSEAVADVLAASDVAAACDVALSVVVAGAVDVAGAVLAGASALVAGAVVETVFVAAGVVSATVLVSTKDAVVSPASATGEIGAAVVSVFSSACAVPPIIISVPSNTEQTPIFNLRREKRLFFSLNKSLPIILHNNWISHYPIALPKNLF
ncbi:hypothetical protein HSISS2_1719 [Streptococcus sp. HSISS2]|nr:hypothetical protein HSISS2_1719 [Streptococcus sp. HSISS2]